MTLAETAKGKLLGLDIMESLFNGFLLEFITAGKSVGLWTHRADFWL